MTLRAAAYGWGSTRVERDLVLPCDSVVLDAPIIAFRAVDVEAPTELVFRWLCQLREAPYSYDLIDNLGRQSPQRLTPGTDQLERGQRFMTIFRLVEFEHGRQVTLAHSGRVAGRVAVTYLVDPAGPDSARLVMKLCWKPSSVRVVGRALRAPLLLGDLVMARRQLLNLKHLAERDARADRRDRGSANPTHRGGNGAPTADGAQRPRR